MADTQSLNHFQKRWEEAHRICETRLNKVDQRYISEIKDCNAFKTSIEEMHITFQDLSRPSIISQLDKSLVSIRSFVTLVAVAAGWSPFTAAILWGVLSLAVKLASDMQIVLTDTIEMLAGLGHDLEILQILNISFEENHVMDQELVDTFVDIINFWTKAIHFLRRRRGHGSDALAPWRELKNDFEKSSRKIKDRSTRLKEKADAIASAASASRAAIQLRRLDAYSTQDRDDVSMFTPSEAMSKIDLHDVFPCHNIPFAPNEGFYGRSKELDAVVTSCSQSDEKMVSFVLWGMGGIGKTQIAAQYAHQSYVSGTQAVLWVNCETGLSISKSFKEIVQLLHLSGPVVDDNSDQNRLRVLQWLSKADQRWLLVLDNVEDSKLAEDCWPMAYRGTILVTSRRNIVAVDLKASNLHVEPFSREEGADVLQKRAGREQTSDEERKAAESLSTELGGHALALTIMGAQVALRQKSFVDFLKLYQRNKERLHGDVRGVPTEYGGALTACWDTAFASLKEESRMLLGMLVLIAPDNIPASLFEPHDLTDISDKFEFFKEEMDIDDAFELLFDTSLVTRQPDARMMGMHRLIRHEFGKRLDKHTQTVCFLAAAELLCAAFPNQVDGNSLWPEVEECNKFSQHVLRLCANWRERRGQGFPPGSFQRFIKLLTNAGWFLYETGAWSEVIELMDVAFESCEDKESLDYAHLCSTWGCLQIERGRAREAKKVLEDCLNIRCKLLDEDHVEIANIWNNLGNDVLQIYDSEEATAEAITCWQKALEIYYKAPVEEQAELLFASLLNITRAYRLAGDMEQATKYMELTDEAIQIAFPLGGHWEATAHVHRAHILYDQGKITESEVLWRKAHEIFFAHNATHPATISAELKLACIEMRRGEVEVAINKLERLRLITELREKAKGDKGEIARVTRRLAEAYGLKGDHEKEARLTLQAESMRKAIQRGRAWQLPDSERSYDILVYNEYW